MIEKLIEKSTVQLLFGDPMPKNLGRNLDVLLDLSEYLDPTYYVDFVGGNDANDGLTTGTAFKHCPGSSGQTGVCATTVLGPNDVVNFKGGVIYSGGVYCKFAGAAGFPITYTSVAGWGAGKPIIENSGTYSYDFYVDHNYTIIDGFLAQGGATYGVRYATGSDHGIIRNCEITNAGIGINCVTSNNTFTLNTIHHLNMVLNNNNNGDYGAEGIFVLNGSYNDISYNTLHHCIAVSLFYGHDGGAFEFYGNCTGNHFHHNLCYENCGFMEIAGAGAADHNIDTVIDHNIAYDNLQGNFATMHNTVSDGFLVTITNLKMEHNTIVELTYNGWILGFTGSFAAGKVYFRNNITYTKSGAAFSYNDYTCDRSYNLFNFEPDGGLKTGEATGDAAFVNLAGFDLHLTETSDAIKAGTYLGYTIDYDGRSLPPATPDIGAYQWTRLVMVRL